MPDLSVLIPARSEMFLARTIQDILQHAEGDTEIIVVCDGNWPDPRVDDHPQVTLVYHDEPIGQRAATNEAAKLSDAEFVMKCDAHCAFDQGFDVKLMADCEPDWTIIPQMRNLHAFDWQCVCGDRTYQGPYPERCKECESSDGFEMVVVWEPRAHTRNCWMRFDRDLKFQYWKAYKKRAKGALTDTMSLIGAAWMMRRDRFWELDGMDEAHGSWGQMGTEIACKTWLSGGRLVCSKKTWFAHLFRTQRGFGFPYPNPGIQRAREYSQQMWKADKPDEMPDWDKAVHPLSWLIDKFAPVPGWEEPVTKALLYYTCNEHDERIEMAARKQLLAGCDGYQLAVVSLKPVQGFGDWNIVLERERSVVSMHQQILTGLEHIKADVVFLTESDVLYHPSHFDFVPPRDDTFYYNTNVWRVRFDDGHAVWTDDLHQVSGLCAYRDLLLDFYRERVEQIEEEGFNRHFEPGLKQTVGSQEVDSWRSEGPNLDIRHGKTLTRSKWAPSEFRNARYAKGWKEASEVQPWGRTEGRLLELLDGIAQV